MAATSGNSAIRVGGQLYHTPTSLSMGVTGYGTALGPVYRVQFDPNVKTVVQTLEESGRVHKVRYCRQRPRLGFSMESFDADALALLFPSLMTGGLKGPQLQDKTGFGTYGPGGEVTPVKLLFVAERAEHPSLILYRAYPLVEETARILLMSVYQLALPLLFECGANANNWVYQWNKLSELSLDPAA